MQELIAFFTLLMMGASLLLIVIPAVPVSALEWALVMVYMTISIVITGESKLTLFSGSLITGLAIAGSTSSWWLPIIGLRGRGLTCGGMLAFFAGMIVGSIALPIPFLGTIVGGMLGIMIVEYGRIRQWQQAWASGQAALRIILYSMLAELFFALAIIAVFIVTILS